MAHSYVSSLMHCVFSTKERQRLISPDLMQRLFPYLGGIARVNGMIALLSEELTTTFTFCWRFRRRSRFPRRSN